MSKIALPIAELKPALTGLGKVINRRCALPVLTHVKIDHTKDGWTALTVTDLDRAVTVRMEQPSDGPADSFLVPYEELLKITKNCQKDDRLLIRSCQEGPTVSVIMEYAVGKQVAEARVESISVEEFPPIPRIKGDPITVPDALRTSIHQAMGCASEDETRFIINSAYIDVTQPECHHVVGTDGKHLFSSNSFSLPLKESLIIPRNKFLEWKEFNADGEWQLRVDTKEKENDPPPFQISSRRWRFISKQIEGNFPNWRQVVPDPANYKTSLEFNPDRLEEICQTILRMPCDDLTNFALGLEWKGNRLHLFGRSPNAEKWTKVEVQEVKGQGKEITIFLNRHLVTKALEFGLSKVEFIDGMSPMRFVNEGRQMIVMPTRPNAPATATPAPEEPPPLEQAASVAPEPEQPAAINAAPQERKPMISDTTDTAPATTASKLEEAIDAVEALKTTFQETVTSLKELGGKLKAVQKEQKSNEREVQSVRSTLRSLQSVKI